MTLKAKLEALLPTIEALMRLSKDIDKCIHVRTSSFHIYCRHGNDNKRGNYCEIWIAQIMRSPMLNIETSGTPLELILNEIQQDDMSTIKVDIQGHHFEVKHEYALNDSSWAKLIKEQEEIITR